MNEKIVSEADVKHFIEKGWVKVKQAFPREIALRAQDRVWHRLEKLGIRKADPSTWTEPMAHLEEAYDDDEFQLCNTLRFANAVDELEGIGRTAKRVVHEESEERTTYGWWPVNFAKGADQEWDVPKGGWHWDGIHFRHYVDSPEQGLLTLCLFSDIRPRGGGTLVAEGSHQVVARYLASKPDGVVLQDGVAELNRTHPWLSALTGGEALNELAGPRIDVFMNRTYTDDEGTRLRVVETTGEPGDVLLCHPFLYHAPSQNHLRVPRFMCNKTMPLKEKLQLNRNNPNDYSHLELSIVGALASRSE